MTGQPYRVIADRDKGQDVHAPAQLDGDRLTWIEYVGPNVHRELVRIERPVPTDAPRIDNTKSVEISQHPSLPTREQIAEAVTDAADEIERILVQERTTLGMSVQDWLRQRAALLQKGADRG